MIYFQDFSGCVFGIIENKMEVVVRKGEKHDNHTWHYYILLFLHFYFFKKNSDCKIYCKWNIGRLDILFSSNHNIHKSSHGLCFWASDPLIDKSY